ncbi:phosphatase PAP2 family protein [Microbacterium sp. GXS0129]|uniref:phosphatase PAP2 family protein n=1 Tax=Microbacterium sp. GXS0129 TaxID=3377836 RepID=UPI00383BB665
MRAERLTLRQQELLGWLWHADGMSDLRAARPRPAVWIPVALAVVLVVAVVGVLVRDSAAVNDAELSFLHDLSAMHTSLLTPIALAVNIGFGPVGAVIISLIVAVVIGMSARAAWPAVRFGLLVAVPWLVVDVIKAVVSRPRPDAGVLVEQLIREPASASYPSGHTAFAAALGVALVWTVVSRTHRAAPVVVAAAVAAVLALVTAWSRMYLGVHHPTDVTASLLVVPVVSTAVFAVAERAVSARGPRSVAAADDPL